MDIKLVRNTLSNDKSSSTNMLLDELLSIAIWIGDCGPCIAVEARALDRLRALEILVELLARETSPEENETIKFFLESIRK